MHAEAPEGALESCNRPPEAGLLSRGRLTPREEREGSGRPRGRDSVRRRQARHGWEGPGEAAALTGAEEESQRRASKSGGRTESHSPQRSPSVFLSAGASAARLPGTLRIEGRPPAVWARLGPVTELSPADEQEGPRAQAAFPTPDALRTELCRRARGCRRPDSCNLPERSSHARTRSPRRTLNGC